MWRWATPMNRQSMTVSCAIRLAVELPLYFAGDRVVELGIARIVLGLPLYSIVLVVTVLVVQALRRRRAA